MLRSPPVFSLVDNTYEQYVLNHRLNFKHWKLVDVDNYMKGNQYYSEFVTAETWNKKHRESWDNSYKNIPIDKEADLEPFKNMIESIFEAMKTKEPQSNYDMPIRNRKKEEARLEKEAAEKLETERIAAEQLLKEKEKKPEKGEKAEKGDKKKA
jgi:hypothetical protein